jgi:hypothetical protein
MDAERVEMQIAALLDQADVEHARMLNAYSDDGDRRFRFIVTGLERDEVLVVDDSSVGHDGVGVGTGFGSLGGTS